MNAIASHSQADHWLAENGPKELEGLFRAIVFQRANPILLTNNHRQASEASVGVSQFLGLSREEIIGRSLDDFTEPAMKPVMPDLWQELLEEGEQEGSFWLTGPDGSLREVEYTAKTNILPVRHLLILRDKRPGKPDIGPSGTGEDAPIDVPAWTQDFALFLLDTDGEIVAWYEGAERIYGYKSGAVVGRPISIFSPGQGLSSQGLSDQGLSDRGLSDPSSPHGGASDKDMSAMSEMLRKTARNGHTTTEEWHEREDGSRFWASIIIIALKDASGDLNGFGCAVRDFSDRHNEDEKLRHNRSRPRLMPRPSAVVGTVTGEYHRIAEANDAFLELMGYDRHDLHSGLMQWPQMTPPEYLALDAIAHEEDLRFGACTPYEKELIRKDGTRIQVLVGTSVLKVSPFIWITYVADVRDCDRAENTANLREFAPGETGKVTDYRTSTEATQMRASARTA